MTAKAEPRPKPAMLRDIEPTGGIAERLAEIRRAEGRETPATETKATLRTWTVAEITGWPVIASGEC